MREANANAHVLTHSAVEMGTAEAHRLAAKSHREVAAMHTRCMRGAVVMSPHDAAQKLYEDALDLLGGQERGQHASDVDEDLRLLALANVWLDVARELEWRFRVRAFPLRSTRRLDRRTGTAYLSCVPPGHRLCLRVRWVANHGKGTAEPTLYSAGTVVLIV